MSDGQLSYYDLASYDAEEYEKEGDRKGPPMLNLFAAAAYMGGLLQNTGLQYAVMGGFAMVCRGSSRSTTDVDIATNATMKQLWNMIEPTPGNVLPRLVIPNTKLLDKVIRIFVRTGPSLGDEYCAVDELVEVDLNVFGGGSGPSNLNQHIEVTQVEFEDNIFHLNILDVYYMMRTKLRTLTSREATRDFDDLDYLLLHYGCQITQIADRINLEDRAAFVEMNLVQEKGPVAVWQYQKLLQL